MSADKKSTPVQGLATEKLLSLVSDAELLPFAKLLDYDIQGSDPRAALAGFIQESSRARVISALIALNGIWIAMMRDMLAFLESCGISLRTTGCVLMLQTESSTVPFQLSPQIAELVARFDKLRLSPKKAASWEEILARFKKVDRWIWSIRNHASVSSHREYTIDQMVQARITGSAPMPERQVYIDRHSFQKMFDLWRTLDFLATKLGVPDEAVPWPSPMLNLSKQLKRQVSGFKKYVWELQHDHEAWQEIRMAVRQVDPWTKNWPKKDLFHPLSSQGDKQWDLWLALIEDILSLADLETSPEASDLLQLELLKDRPRLFEVWCVTRILAWYRGWGCKVQLESLSAGDNPVWQLNYAKASQPIARIESGDRTWWLFYQLFRTGKNRANMPDLALLDGPDANANVVWIADPKYSEKEGYTLKDYEETAARYRDAFNPGKVWICEFYERRHWFNGAASKTGNGFQILSEVRPDGEGTRLLREEIKTLHQFRYPEFVLVVDCSASFQATLETIQKSVQRLADTALTTICFNRVAQVLVPGEIFDPPAFAGTNKDTLLQPLVQTIQDLSLPASKQTDLVFVGDNEFSDDSTALREALTKPFAQIEIANSEATIADIVARRCGAEV